MGVVINAIKARVALIAIVNAIGLVLSGVGKISQETLALWTEQVGNIFDWCLLIFGAISLLLPGITQFVRVENVADKLGMFVIGMLLMGFVAACSQTSELSDVDGNPYAPGGVCFQTPNGRACYLPNQPDFPVPLE